MPQSVDFTSTCLVAVTLFENSSLRLENFARFALAAVAQFMPISQLRRIRCEYGLGASILPLPSSRRRTRLCPIKRQADHRRHSSLRGLISQIKAWGLDHIDGTDARLRVDN